MKKMIVVLVAGAAVAFTVNAQKLKPAQVPAAVKSAFEKKYAGAKEVKWEKEGATDYEVNFELNKQEMSAVFTPSGAFEESEVEVKANQIPAAATGYLASHYKGKKVKEYAKITKANGEVNYEAEVSGVGDVLFDSNGKFIKAIKPVKDDKEEKDGKD
jgi:hypothetical protein